jgi:hypothetical protein
MVDGLSPLAMPEILHMESTADVLQRHCILHELWLDQGPARPEMIKNRPLWDSLAAVCFVFGGWGGGGGCPAAGHTKRSQQQLSSNNSGTARLQTFGGTKHAWRT